MNDVAARSTRLNRILGVLVSVVLLASLWREWSARQEIDTLKEQLGKCVQVAESAQALARQCTGRSEPKR